MLFAKKGSTLMEVLISFAIMGTVGVSLLGFQYRSPMSEKAYHDDYGRELSKLSLYRARDGLIAHDTLLEYRDSLGVPWIVQLHVITEIEERCFYAVADHLGEKASRKLSFCTYGQFHD